MTYEQLRSHMVCAVHGPNRTYLRLAAPALAFALAPPVSRGGNPVCWVNRRPLTGGSAFPLAAVEFFLRALV